MVAKSETTGSPYRTDGGVESRPRWWILGTVVLVVLADLFLPAVGSRLAGGLAPADVPPVRYGLLGAHAVHWLLVGVIVLVVLFAEQHPLRTLGARRPRWSDLLWLVLAVAAGYLGGPALALAMAGWLVGAWWRRGRPGWAPPVVGAVVGLLLGLGAAWLIARAPEATTRTSEIITQLTLPDAVLLVVTAAVTEEVLFRGYLVERVRMISGQLWVGLLVSQLLFMLKHLDDVGWLGVLTSTVVGATIFTVLYARTRNLWVCIAAHALLDAPVILAVAAA